MATPATNTQMQTGADQWWRPYWERVRALKLFGDALKQNSDSWYARAISTTLWGDTRSDFPRVSARGRIETIETIETVFTG